jgi:hypothetical protein
MDDLLEIQHFFRMDNTNLAASTVQETVAKLGEIFRSYLGYNSTCGLGSERECPWTVFGMGSLV